MGDLPPNSRSHTVEFTATGPVRDDQHAPLPPSSAYTVQENNTPFHSQLSSISHEQHRSDLRSSAQSMPYYPSQQHEHPAFKMSAIAGALPDYSSDTGPSHNQATQTISRSLSSASPSALVYQPGQGLQMPTYASTNMPVHLSYGSGYTLNAYQQGYMPPQNVQSGIYSAHNLNQSQIRNLNPLQNPYQQYPQNLQYMYYPSPYGAQGQYSTGYTGQGVQGQAMFGRRASTAAPVVIPEQNGEPSSNEGGYTGARTIQGDLAANTAAFGTPFYQIPGTHFHMEILQHD